jgi:integrase
MAKRGLNNFIRKPFFRNGKASWALESLDGTPVEAFGIFCEKNTSYSHQTQKRYAEVVSRFIDYLQEANAFGIAVSQSHLNKVIDAYSTLIQDGSDLTTKRVRSSGQDLWLADAAEKLDWDPLKTSSLDNTIAAVNRFLRLSESLALEARERAKFLGIDLSYNSQTLITSIAGTTSIPPWEVTAMRQATMFGNVAKFAPNGITRAKGIRAPSGSRPQTRELDFPRESLASLIGKATTWRDKCLWLLLATVGVRTSEALNLLVDDIDLEAQKIYIFDPSGKRALIDDGDPKRLRFKGREMAFTYPIPDLKRDLFYAIEQYLKLEFVPYCKAGQANHLLQYMDSQHRGQPYVDASDAALSSSFLKAVNEANIPIPTGAKNWGLHSLRHMYGVYCVNDYPLDIVNDQYGLPLTSVQMMMGHARINSTAHYARTKHRRLEAKLMTSDLAMLAMSHEELKSLPGFNVKLLGMNK